MSEVVRYCKAFTANKFEQFPGWPRERVSFESSESDTTSQDAVAEDYLFLHDTYIVTRGIVHDEDIVFNEISPEWIEFCKTELEFSIPEDLIEETGSEEETSARSAATV
jgi:hypothetical protein